MTQEENEAKIAQLEQEISDLKGTNEESVTTSSQKEPKKEEDVVPVPVPEKDTYIEEFLKEMSVPADAKVGTNCPGMRGAGNKGVF